MTNKFSNSWKQFFKTYLIGFFMGSADLVPGVSGGTIAFIFGIYEKLVASIKTITGDVIKLALKGKILAAVKKMPLSFLIPLAGGLLSAVATLTSLITYLLTYQPVYLWSTFFGFVLASIIVVGKRIKKWNLKLAITVGLSAYLAFLITGAVPMQTPSTPLAFFLSGAIAICAMILPGISGSFMLVIMGKYEQVISAVANKEFLTLIIFATGAVLGLAIFSRILTYLFKNFHNTTIAFLTGFMIGSLRKIWPFKEVIEVGKEINILPSQLDATVFFAILFCLAGVALITLIEKNNKQQKSV